MECYFDSGKIQLNKIKDLRRDAYVDVLMRSARGEKLLGIFSNSYDESFIRACGLIPIPLQALDSGIFEYGNHTGCDLIKASLIYLKTDKCPILHSCMAYAFDDFCPKFYKEFKLFTNKDIYIKNKTINTFGDFCQSIGSKYESSIQNKSQDIINEIIKIQSYLESTDLTGVELMHLDFYTRFILDLEERLAFFERIMEYPYKKVEETRREVKAICPWAIGFEIEKLISHKHYKLVVSKTEPSFGLDNCIYKPKQTINY